MNAKKKSGHDRFDQMHKQQELIERKKLEIQAKIEEKKRIETEEALKKLGRDVNSKAPLNSKKNMHSRFMSYKNNKVPEDLVKPVLNNNIFSNDGSFLQQFHKISGIKAPKLKKTEPEDSEAPSTAEDSNDLKTEDVTYEGPENNPELTAPAAPEPPSSTTATTSTSETPIQYQQVTAVSLSMITVPSLVLSTSQTLIPIPSVIIHTSSSSEPHPPPPINPLTIPPPSPLHPPSIPPPSPLQPHSIPPPNPLQPYTIPPPPPPTPPYMRHPPPPPGVPMHPPPMSIPPPSLPPSMLNTSLPPPPPTPLPDLSVAPPLPSAFMPPPPTPIPPPNLSLLPPPMCVPPPALQNQPSVQYGVNSPAAGQPPALPNQPQVQYGVNSPPVGQPPALQNQPQVQYGVNSPAAGQPPALQNQPQVQYSVNNPATGQYSVDGSPSLPYNVGKQTSVQYGMDNQSSVPYSVGKPSSVQYRLENQPSVQYSMDSQPSAQYSVGKQSSAQYNVDNQSSAQYSVGKQSSAQYSMDSQPSAQYSVGKQTSAQYSLDSQPSAQFSGDNQFSREIQQSKYSFPPPQPITQDELSALAHQLVDKGEAALQNIINSTPSLSFLHDRSHPRYREFNQMVSKIKSDQSRANEKERDRDLKSRERERDIDMFSDSSSKDKDMFSDTRSRDKERDMFSDSRSRDKDGDVFSDSKSRDKDRDMFSDSRSRDKDRDAFSDSRSRDKDRDMFTDSRSWDKDRDVFSDSRSRDKDRDRSLDSGSRYERVRDRSSDSSSRYERDRDGDSGGEISRFSRGPETAEEKNERRARKRKSRWGEGNETPLLSSATHQASVLGAGVPPPGVALPVALGQPVPLPQKTINVPGMHGPAISQIGRSDPALLAYAQRAFGTTNLSEEDWKKAEDHYKISLLYQDMLKKREQLEKLKAKGRQKYEYDSDEETDGGTWEHKLRMQEMEATRIWANELTEKSRGKHHIGDFLPPDELERFMEKYDAMKDGREPDLSDYKEFKLKEDNVGFQMLQKLGWQEGSGLGQDGTGIQQPVNKASTRVDNQGLGVERPDDLTGDDDEFDAYRKRMMLAYRFRPNPLNNPRRPYY